MMGERSGSQGRFFYRFDLEKRVPADHLLRKIDAVLDLSKLRSQLAPHYSHTGRPSIDPELMIRMLLIGYCYGIRSDVRSTVRSLARGQPSRDGYRVPRYSAAGFSPPASTTRKLRVDGRLYLRVVR